MKEQMEYVRSRKNGLFLNKLMKDKGQVYMDEELEKQE